MRGLSAYDMGLSPFPDADSRRPFLGDTTSTTAGLVATGATGGNPVAGAIVSEGVQLVENMFGGSGKYGTVNSEGAEQARVDAAVLGAEHGSVPAAQYLLGQAQSDTSNYAKQATQAGLSKLQLSAPSVLAQAQQLGPVYDAADGLGVLTILWNLQIPFADQYAGYNTTTTQPGSAQAMQLASKLKTINPNATTVGGLPASINLAGTPVQTNTLLLGGALLAAIVFVTKRTGK